MKKNRFLVCGFVFGLLLFQFSATSSSLTEETVFITSYWNSVKYESGIGLDDWNEAGVVGFIITGYRGNLYVKNDNQNLYLGVLVLGELNGSITWRVNFDVDADGYWAEDAKELQITEVGGDNFQLEIDDQRYLQGNPTPFSDSQEDDFTGRFRSFELLGEYYTIFELTIPLQSDDPLNDLTIANPEESILGVSLDVFNFDLGSNATWKGNSYPNFANSNNYALIIFAGPQDRKIPDFEDDTPLETTTLDETEDERTWYSGAADGFELWISLLSIGSIAFVLYRRRRRN